MGNILWMIVGFVLVISFAILFISHLHCAFFYYFLHCPNIVKGGDINTYVFVATWEYIAG